MKKLYLFFYAIIALSFIAFTFTSNAQAPNWLWAKSASTGSGTCSNCDNIAMSVAVDASGNTYMAGYFQSDTIIFGSTILMNTTTATAIFLAKYDANGNIIWAKSAEGTYASGGNQANSVAVDASGNAYVAGYFYGTTISFGSVILTNNDNSGGQNMFLAKYDTNGNVIWAKTTGGTDSDGAGSVALDTLGNAYVAGWFSNSNTLINPTIITFGSTTFTNSDTSDFTDIFLAKYDANGNMLWVKSASGIGNDDATSVAVDVLGNIYVGGMFEGNIITFGSTTLTNDDANVSYDFFLAKYDFNGNVIWAKSADVDYSGNNAGLYSIALDALGNAYVAGGFQCPNITLGSTTLTNTGNENMFLAKYDTNGNVLWAKSADGTYRSTDLANSIATDISGNVYVAGYFSSYTITFGSTTFTNAGYDTTAHMFLVKYDVNGNVLYAKTADGTSSNLAFPIAVDISGNAYVAGLFWKGSITFGNTTLVNASTTTDMFLAKLGNSTGINELSNSLNIAVYPNPASEIVTIDASTSLSIHSVSLNIPMAIEITNIEGQLIKTLITSSNKTDVDVSTLPSGVYFVKVKTEKGMMVEKFIKE